MKEVLKRLKSELTLAKMNFRASETEANKIKLESIEYAIQIAQEADINPDFDINSLEKQAKEQSDFNQAHALAIDLFKKAIGPQPSNAVAVVGSGDDSTKIESSPEPKTPEAPATPEVLEEIKSSIKVVEGLAEATTITGTKVKTLAEEVADAASDATLSAETAESAAETAEIAAKSAEESADAALAAAESAATAVDILKKK